jgi:hypothetical protein
MGNSGLNWENTRYNWDETNFVWELVKRRSGGGDFIEEIYKYDAEKKDKLISITLKVYGDTITESKKRQIKQYKIKAKDIKLVVKEVLGVEMIAENVSF